MKNVPDIIYLNINEPFKEIEDFNDLRSVTWSKDRTYVDISYYSLKLLKQAYEAGFDACGQLERGHGELKEFEEWFNREIVK
jgi:hypothetical protein